MLFTFPSRYLCAIGLTGVFSLAGWARRVRTGFHVPRPTQVRTSAVPASRKGLSPSTAGLSRPFRSPSRSPCRPSYNPGDASTTPVWADPRSLAATGGITVVFFSCGYWDVSVPRVRLPPPAGCAASCRTGCPIRVSADHRRLAPPRGFSQLATPFVASVSQGIHRAPFSVARVAGGVATPRAFLALLSSSAGGPPPLPRARPRDSRPGARARPLWQHVIGLFAGSIPALSWRMTDSNRRPPACKAGALAS